MKSIEPLPTDIVSAPRHAINVTKGGAIVASHVIMAETSAQRRRGLSGLSILEADHTLYISPCEWVHTFGMKFPIDVAFLAKDGRILAIQSNLKPNRLSKIIFRAEGILELAAGRLAATDSAVGDILEFRATDIQSSAS